MKNYIFKKNRIECPPSERMVLVTSFRFKLNYKEIKIFKIIGHFDEEFSRKDYLIFYGKNL